MTFAVAPPLVALTAAGSVFCFALSLIPTSSPFAQRLKKLETIEERSPSKRLEKIDRILSEETRSRLQQRLVAAGWYHVSPAALTLRSAGGLLGGLLLAVALFAVLPNKAIAVFAGILLGGIGARYPKIAVDRAIAARREQISRDLPDFLDLLAATVRAGLALNAALVHAVQVLSGPLAEELRETLAEIRIGRPRADALRAMATRVNEAQTSAMVTSIVQADRLGANLTAVLRELAVDTRNRRWLLAEERAARLPIKMIFPMALLMLPSLYIMMFTPVVAQFLGK